MSGRHRTAIRIRHVQALRDRDGDDCALCGYPIWFEWYENGAPHREGAGRNTHKCGPSIDHVTPLSKGGRRVLHNERLTHMWCNSRRGTRRRWNAAEDPQHRFQVVDFLRLVGVI